MKSDPSKLIDSEGEALSLNKVDKALQSVGISLQDANHQFRDFDDVILEFHLLWFATRGRTRDSPAGKVCLDGELSEVSA